MRKVWSEEDENTLREWGPKISLQRLAVRMKRNQHTLRDRARLLNIKTCRAQRLSCKDRQL
jgi:hypothetical protein